MKDQPVKHCCGHTVTISMDGSKTERNKAHQVLRSHRCHACRGFAQKPVDRKAMEFLVCEFERRRNSFVSEQDQRNAEQSASVDNEQDFLRALKWDSFDAD